jgi:hypothetical protein
MAKRHTLTVTLPDGKIDTRTTTHAYTHVVANLNQRRDGVTYWKVLHWTHSEANARKYGYGVILPVNSEEETKRLLAEGAPKFEYPAFQYTPELIADEWHHCCVDIERLEGLLQRNTTLNPDGLYVKALAQYIADRRAGLEYARQQSWEQYKKSHK